MDKQIKKKYRRYIVCETLQFLPTYTLLNAVIIGFLYVITRFVFSCLTGMFEININTSFIAAPFVIMFGICLFACWVPVLANMQLDEDTSPIKVEITEIKDGVYTVFDANEGEFIYVTEKVKGKYAVGDEVVLFYIRMANEVLCHMYFLEPSMPVMCHAK